MLKLWKVKESFMAAEAGLRWPRAGLGMVDWLDKERLG